MLCGSWAARPLQGPSADWPAGLGQPRVVTCHGCRQFGGEPGTGLTGVRRSAGSSGPQVVAFSLLQPKQNVRGSSPACSLVSDCNWNRPHYNDQPIGLYYEEHRPMGQILLPENPSLGLTEADLSRLPNSFVQLTQPSFACNRSTWCAWSSTHKLTKCNVTTCQEKKKGKIMTRSQSLYLKPIRAVGLIDCRHESQQDVEVLCLMNFAHKVNPFLSCFYFSACHFHFSHIAQVPSRFSQVDLTGRPGEVCPPVMLVDRIFLIEVEFEEFVVAVTFIILVSG